MDSIKLVSAGNDVKIWNGDVLDEQFAPYGTMETTSHVRWSPDGNFLAASASSGRSIVVSHFKSLAVTEELQTDTPQNVVHFGHTSSRTIATCGDHHSVVLWNLHSKQKQKKLNSSLKSVKCIAFNWNDTHIACGSSKGEVVVVNVSSGIRNPVMKLTNQKRPICSLAFSSTTKCQLGALSDDGSLNLWNVNTHVLVHGFDSTHVAPATGFAFSPVNDKLAVSVGLDKRIIFYDVRRKEVFLSSMLDEPITCLDFADGVSLTLGTMSGNLHYYDLRTSSVKQVVPAHQSSVNSIHYRKCTTLPKGNGPSVNESRSAVKHDNTIVVNSSTQQNATYLTPKTVIDKSVVFSPLSDMGTPSDQLPSDSPLGTLINDWKGRAAGDMVSMVCERNSVTGDASMVEQNLPDKMEETVNDVTLNEPVPEVRSSIAPTLSLANAETTATGSVATVPVPTLDFSLLRSVLVDVMDDFSDMIHKDIINLHVDVIKKFQLQQIHFEARLEQVSTNEKLLLDEIDRLRAEIRRLRMGI